MQSKKLVDVAICIAAIAVLLTVVSIAMPIDYPLYFNFDESMELVRVHLLKQNYVFFKDTWNDHPLGLPRIFQAFSNFIEITLPSARRIVLFFSVVNVIIFYSLLRLECNRIAATIAVLILMTSFQYIPLSASALKELPALTLVMASFLLMYLYARSTGKVSYLYLFLCALIFVLSLEIKLSGLTAIPALVAIGVSGKSRWQEKIKDAAIWIVAALVVFVFLSVTILPFSPHYLLESHQMAIDEFASQENTLTLSDLLKTAFQSDTVYALLTLAAIGSLYRIEKTIFLPPLLLLGFNLLRFSKVSPVWPHYYIHLAFPAAWLIALTIARLDLQSAWISLRERRLNRARVILPLVLILPLFAQLSFNSFKILTAKHPRRYRHPVLAFYNEQAQKYKPLPAEAFLERYKGSQKMILTDNPYFIHQFKLNTPPETAILSRKRLITEGLDGEFILKIIQKRKPDFVLMDRFTEEFMKSKALSQFLKNNYTEYPLDRSRSRLFIANN